MEKMDDEKTPLKAKNFAVDKSKKGRPKKRQKKIEKGDAGCRYKKNGCVRPLFMKVWLQTSSLLLTGKMSRVPGR